MKRGIDRRQFLHRSLVGTAARPSLSACWQTRPRVHGVVSPNDGSRSGSSVSAPASSRALLDAAPRRARRRGRRRLRRLQGPRRARARAARRQGEGLRRLPRSARGPVDRRRDHRDAGPLARAADDRGAGGGQGRLPREADDARDRRGSPDDRRGREERPHPPDRQQRHELEAAADGARDRRPRAGSARSRLVRASYDRNTDSGAWLYPIPPDANEQTVDWEMFLGPAPRTPFGLERFFRWRCYWDYSGGIATDLFVHLMTTIHYVMGATVPELVMATGANYRHQKTHEVPDTLNASAVYGKERFSVSLSATFNNAASSDSGFVILGSEGSLAMRGGRLILAPEHPVEGNDWIVASWPSALERAYWADPEVQKREKPDTWPSAIQDAGRELAGGRARLDRAPHGALLRLGEDAQALGAGRARGTPRGRRRAHGERVDPPAGAGALGLRQGRAAGRCMRRRTFLTTLAAAAAAGREPGARLRRRRAPGLRLRLLPAAATRRPGPSSRWRPSGSRRCWRR